MRRVGMLASLVGVALCLLPTQARAASNQDTNQQIQNIINQINGQAEATQSGQPAIMTWFEPETVAPGGTATLYLQHGGVVTSCVMIVTYENGQPPVELPVTWQANDTASWSITAPTAATSVNAWAVCQYKSSSSSLLDGSFTTKSFQVGQDANETITFSIPDLSLDTGPATAGLVVNSPYVQYS